MSFSFDSAILEKVALRTKLSEGKEGVRLVLREIYQRGPIGTKSLARIVRIPIPIIAALRKELEAVDLISRNKHGAILTDDGVKFVEQILGFSFLEDLTCTSCSGTGIIFPLEHQRLLVKQTAFANRRPQPLTRLDQAFATPETALRRAYFLLKNDDLEGRSILLLGDDDLTSLAISLLPIRSHVTVVDIDQRLLDLISSIAKEESFDINCVPADLREPLPEQLQNKFDVVLTDPPYTIPGLELFISRALQALKPEENLHIYLAFAHRPPNQLHSIHSSLLAHGLALQQLIPNFNQYEGAEMHANTTFLAQLATTNETTILIPSSFKKDIYTGGISPTRTEYRCENGHIIPVGSREKVKTIEELKLIGCPLCGSKESFTRISRKKVN
ncbi:MAG: putative methyltransferase [Candidatus Heimdallarchaeota archaeon]|nr:putative methyltransferase [Candidatus Heimdallarchaeota archaeon]